MAAPPSELQYNGSELQYNGSDDAWPEYPVPVAGPLPAGSVLIQGEEIDQLLDTNSRLLSDIYDLREMAAAEPDAVAKAELEARADELRTVAAETLALLMGCGSDLYGR